MIANHITRRVVPVECSPLDRNGAPKGCRGVLQRMMLSRLEEGLGHEGYRCTVCGRTVKHIPGGRPCR